MQPTVPQLEVVALVLVVVVAVAVTMVIVVVVPVVVIAVRYYDWCVSMTTGGVLSHGGREELQDREGDGKEMDAADAVRRWRHCYTGWRCRHCGQRSSPTNGRT